MYLLILLYFPLYNGFFYGEIIHQEDRVFKNNSYTYYYDNVKLQHLKNKYHIKSSDKSNLKCKNNSDCQLDWCTSASKCSKEGICLMLMGYPCPQTMKCNPQKRICEYISCFTRYECSDSLYCNGYELCENRLCKRSKHPCLYGTCLESNKSCLFTDHMNKVLNNKTFSAKMEVNENQDNKLLYSNSYISVNLSKADELVNILLSGDPLWDSNSLNFQVAFLVIVIVLFILIVGLCIIVAFKPCCAKRIR